MEELKWFLVFFAILGILWFLSGGPTRVEEKNKPFIEQPAPVESGRTYSVEELRLKRENEQITN